MTEETEKEQGRLQVFVCETGNEPKEDGLDGRKREEADLQMTEREKHRANKYCQPTAASLAGDFGIGLATNRRKSSIDIPRPFHLASPIHSCHPLSRKRPINTQTDVTDNRSISKWGHRSVGSLDQALIAF